MTAPEMTGQKSERETGPTAGRQAGRRSGGGSPGVAQRVGWAAVDVGVLVGRRLRHSARSVDALLTAILLPVLIMVMFVTVFGGAIDPGGDYVTYVAPGVVLLCAAFGSATTAVGVTEDMTTGVIDRFRSLPILGASVLAGHVVASVARNVLSTAVVLGVAMLLGFRPGAGPGGWAAAAGLLVLFMIAVSALGAAAGMLARSAESASAFSFVVLFLPYVSSAFAPIDTMPQFLRGFATHQPATPIIETLRALLSGAPAGATAPVALAWCAGLAVLGVGASAWLFHRRTG